VPFWEPALIKRGFRIAPLQAEWVSKKLGLPPQRLLDDLRLLFSNGQMLQGADVYRHVMRRIWWAFPVYLFSVLPGTRMLFDWGYRQFARNRYCISNACRLNKFKI